jgi:hypothetical protein
MNVEIGTEAEQFSEKEYIKWDFPCSVKQAMKGSIRQKEVID